MIGWRLPRFGVARGRDAVVQSLWYGPALTPYEQLSIRSFLDCGHRYRLFTYRSDLEVPEGCEVADAAEILPEERVFFYKAGEGKGSVSAFSNLFRYKLLFERGGWWMDTDVICQTRRLPGGRYVFGRQSASESNSAILKCPVRSQVMRRCLEIAAEIGDNAVWGEAGPKLVSRLVAEERLGRFAKAGEAFYPYEWQDATRALDPRHTLWLTAVCANATFVHLWNEMLRRAGVDKTAPPPAGSYLAGLFCQAWHHVRIVSHARHWSASHPAGPHIPARGTAPPGRARLPPVFPGRGAAPKGCAAEPKSHSIRSAGEQLGVSAPSLWRCQSAIGEPDPKRRTIGLPATLRWWKKIQPCA